MILESICFESRSSTIPKEAMPTLRAVAEGMIRFKAQTEIRASTDDKESNVAQWLLKKRIRAVADALVAAGVSRDLLIVKDEKGAPLKEEGRKLPDRCVRFRVVKFDEGSVE